MIQPRYPVYVPSKGRYDSAVALTVRMLLRDGAPFHVVVEPQEADQYAKLAGEGNVLVLPFSNLGQGSIPARNWIKQHSIEHGHDRHWQLDDNLLYMARLNKGRRIRCDSNVALRVVEDFTDRYQNVALSGLNYEMFLLPNTSYPPFYLNTRVYSATLINNQIPHTWRGRYNEDADLCLQVLAGGWCTILVNQFFVWKKWTMQFKGGNTDDLYQGDGRLRMARSLERMWPRVVTTKRRFGRPQHVINWKAFTTPLQRRDPTDVPKPLGEYDLRLEAVDDVQSPALRSLLEQDA